MSPKQLYKEKLISWSAETNGEAYLSIDRSLSFLSDYLYFDYEPTHGSGEDFYSRLAKWLLNLDNDEKQKLLLKLVPEIFYIGQEEFYCLYKTAYNANVTHWLTDCVITNFETEDYQQLLREALNNTWFCPVSDSFKISQFYHLNEVTSQCTFRPDWRSLKKFGDDEKVVDYILDNKIRYIVLLEDFVGSGRQCAPTLRFASRIIANPRLQGSVSLLFIPLVICPTGIEKANEIVGNNSLMKMSPVISIKESELINEDSNHLNDLRHDWISLIKGCFATVKGTLDNNEIKKLNEFGFENTGSMVVMHTNTPNNSLPLLFVESDSWTPLFKRHSRDR